MYPNFVTANTGPNGVPSLSPVNGTRFPYPYILAQSAVPVILAPNGTVAANGVITLGTALSTTYAGGAWVRLPAGAVVGGLAGLYWCVFSSTTVGALKTLFVDVATPFTPYVPSVALVAAVGSAVAYAQQTGADITLANIIVPGGAMGLGGALRQRAVIGAPTNANAKYCQFKYAGQGISGATLNFTQAGSFGRVFQNAGALNRNKWSGSSSSFTPDGLGSVIPNTIDTSTDQPWVVTCQVAVATDFMILEAFTIEVLPS